MRSAAGTDFAHSTSESAVEPAGGFVPRGAREFCEGECGGGAFGAGLDHVGERAEDGGLLDAGADERRRWRRGAPRPVGSPSSAICALSAGAGTPVFRNASRRLPSKTVRVNPSSRLPKFALGAVPDLDGIERVFVLQIDLPPRLGSRSRACASAIPTPNVPLVLPSIARAASPWLVVDDWVALPLAGDVLPVRKHLDFGKRERAPAGEFDADVTGRGFLWSPASWAWIGAGSASSSGLTFRVGGGAQCGVADRRHRPQEIGQRPGARLRLPATGASIEPSASISGARRRADDRRRLRPLSRTSASPDALRGRRRLLREQAAQIIDALAPAAQRGFERAEQLHGHRRLFLRREFGERREAVEFAEARGGSGSRTEHRLGARELGEIAGGHAAEDEFDARRVAGRKRLAFADRRLPPLFELPERLLEAIVQVVIGRLCQRGQRHIGGLPLAEERAGAHRFEADARRCVGGRDACSSASASGTRSRQ